MPVPPGMGMLPSEDVLAPCGTGCRHSGPTTTLCQGRASGCPRHRVRPCAHSTGPAILILSGARDVGPGVGVGARNRGWGPKVGIRDQGLGLGSSITLLSLPQAFCQRFGTGTHLASVHSVEEHRAIIALLSSSHSSEDSEEEEDWDDGIWIGLHRPLGVSVALGQSRDPSGTPETRSRQPPIGAGGTSQGSRSHSSPQSRHWQWSDSSEVNYGSWHRQPGPRRRACAALQDAAGEHGPTGGTRSLATMFPATSIPGHQHPWPQVSPATSIPSHPQHRLTPTVPASSWLGQPSVGG